MNELLPVLYMLTGGGLLGFGAWGMARILGLHTPTEEEIQAIVSEAIARPFEELDEKLGLNDDDDD